MSTLVTVNNAKYRRYRELRKEYTESKCFNPEITLLHMELFYPPGPTVGHMALVEPGPFDPGPKAETRIVRHPVLGWK